MKRTLCILLALLLMLTVIFTACKKDEGEPPVDEPDNAPVDEPDEEAPPADEPDNEPVDEPDEEAPPEVELEHFNIGWLYYDLSLESFANAKNSFENLGKDLNCEFTYVEANTPDYYMEAIENVLAAGIDAFVTCNTGNMTQQYMEACEAKGVYLATTDNEISGDPGFKELTADNEYFAGWVYYSGYDTNYHTAEIIKGMGAETFVIQTLPAGVATTLDLNYQGWYDGGIDSGMELLGEGRSWNHADTAQNLISQFPDTDAYLCSDFQYVYTPLQSIGRQGDMLINGSQCINATYTAMELGHIMVVTEGVAFEYTVGFLLAYNALTGYNLNPMDGTGGLVMTNSFHFDSFEGLTNWKTHMIDQVPFNKENVSEVLGIYNPDLTYESFCDWVSAWSLDFFK